MILVSCADSPLPLADWEAEWGEVTDHIAATLVAPVDEQVCQDTVGYLREKSPVLTPPPLADLEEPVNSWFATAEGLFFDCQIDGAGRLTDTQSLETLDVLGAEIDVITSMEGG